VRSLQDDFNVGVDGQSVPLPGICQLLGSSFSRDLRTRRRGT
jgi:hypothetical protein